MYVDFSYIELDLRYQLHQQCSELCKLCVTWQRALSELPATNTLPLWGPDECDLAGAHASLSCDLVIDHVEDSDDDYIEIENDELDWGLMESLDVLDLADAKNLEGEHEIL